MIVVAGGSGTLGSRLVAGLAEQGLPVRILTRHLTRPHPSSGGGSIEAMQADVRDPGSLPDALRGATTIVSAMHGFAGTGGVSPTSVDRQGNFHLIDAASDLGAAFILVSVVGARADHPMELCRAKFAAEERLRASGLPWTIVRATSFIETWAGMMLAGLGTKGTIPIFGRGDNPINFVSADDVAALLTLVATDPNQHGRTVELGGSANVTFNQLADVVQQAAGRRARVRHIPRALLRLMALCAGPVNPALARQSRAAVVMDTTDMTFDSTPARREFPLLPNTTLRTAIDALLSDGGMSPARPVTA